MGFYDLDKEQRAALAAQISEKIFAGISRKDPSALLQYFSDEDTYIRKTAYLSIGRIHRSEPRMAEAVKGMLEQLFSHENEKVRQTVVNAAGEIGMYDFGAVRSFMERGLLDKHHSVRNAVIGSIKKMGQKNPLPVLAFAKEYLHHPDKEIRREICHGIELRGRTHPEDILPMLKELQDDKTARVRNTLVHVLGQIAYKKGCLEKVLKELKTWKNRELVNDALEEIIDVHDRYQNFAAMSRGEAMKKIAAAGF